MSDSVEGGARACSPDGATANEMRDTEIRRQLGGQAYARLFATVRERIESSPAGAARTAGLTDLSDEERSAIAGLLGWSRRPDRDVRLDLPALDTALRESRLGASLLDTLEALGGPLTDRRAMRAEATAAREDLWAEASGHPFLATNPDLQAWLVDLRREGALARSVGAHVTAQRELLERALTVISQLPADGRLLAVLASQVTGDAHALDPGRPLAAVVLRAVVRLAGWEQPPRTAAERRHLWHAVGVVCDPISVDVLTLGLRPTGAGRLSRHLRESSDDGEPRRITLRELAGFRLEVSRTHEVFVCENPSIVAAAADQIGARCAPLVCVEGQPTTAALELLRALQAAGSRIRFHADFDWGGIRIGNILRSGMDAEPWRFSAVDYTPAAHESVTRFALEGSAVKASWDSRLSEVMQQQGTALFEEQVIDTLLGDLKSRE